METAKFKIGDEVKLKRGLRINCEYNGLTLLKEMRFKGNRFVEFISSYGSSKINGFYYSPEMLILKAPSK